MKKNYVKEYKGHKVPEGATHFGGKHDRTREDLFYRSNGREVFIFGGWRGPFSNRGDLIELPEAPQEWMPEVGEECEVLHYDKWIKCFYIGFDINHDHVYQFASDFGIHKSYLNVFRPLKTQQEKDREAFIECVKQLLPKSDTDDLILSGKLFDLGFTAPKASGNE